jgi:hypothetical protein
MTTDYRLLATKFTKDDLSVSTQNSLPFKALWNNVKQLFNSSRQAVAVQSINGKARRHEFIVVGLGRFGTSLAMTLNAYKHDVLAIDFDIRRVQEVSRFLPYVIQLGPEGTFGQKVTVVDPLFGLLP